MKQFVGSIRRLQGAILLAIVLMFGASLTVSAQTAPPEPQGPPLISAVEVQYVGPQTISREKVLAQIRTRPGQPYSESLVEQDIKALYKTGQVQNVRIFGQADGEKVKVMVVLQTRSLVNEIEIEGAQRISAQKLRKQIALKINGPLSEDELQKAREKIIETYQGKGFTDIAVKFRVDTDETRGTSRVIFTITEGAKGRGQCDPFRGKYKIQRSDSAQADEDQGQDALFVHR